jgi:outer membrane receptor protein involved in Fe transport
MGMGIFGVNVFYRHVEDIVELSDIGPSPIDPNGSLYTPINIGDGFTWGIEFDASTPLDFIGLPDTGVFANYTYLESEVKDPNTGVIRPFRNQPGNIYNVGLIHTIRSVGMTFGSTYFDRDEGFAADLDETVVTNYDGDLELFVEKRIGDRFVIRLTGSNLLDREKHEHIRTFDGDNAAEILANREAGNVDESEFETEHSGALFQITLRGTF